MGYMETDGLGDTNRQLSDYANLEPIPNGRNEVWRAEYDGQAAIARLRGHVASALRYVRERERASSTSTGSTTGTVLADSP